MLSIEQLISYYFKTNKHNETLDLKFLKIYKQQTTESFIWLCVNKHCSIK